MFIEPLERAIDDFSRAIELDPQLASAYSNLAEAYRIKWMIEEALRDSNIVIMQPLPFFYIRVEFIKSKNMSEKR
ncbi:MAG: tetratricopeptide repeat protein [Desulfobacterales bacterium]